jgi:hypothetical protein
MVCKREYRQSIFVLFLQADNPIVPLVDPIDISRLKVSSDRSGVTSQGVEFETSVDYNGKR